MQRASIAFLAFVAFILVGYRMIGGDFSLLFHTALMWFVMITVSTVVAISLVFKTVEIRAALAVSDASAERVWAVAEKLSYLAGLVAALLGLAVTFRFLGQEAGNFGVKIGASMSGLVFGILQGVFFRLLRVRFE